MIGHHRVRLQNQNNNKKENMTMFIQVKHTQKTKATTSCENKGSSLSSGSPLNIDSPRPQRQRVPTSRDGVLSRSPLRQLRPGEAVIHLTSSQLSSSSSPGPGNERTRTLAVPLQSALKATPSIPPSVSPQQGQAGGLRQTQSPCATNSEWAVLS